MRESILFPWLYLSSIGYVVHGHGVRIGRLRARVDEGHLGGDDQRAAHERGEDGEADVVVALSLVHVALGILKLFRTF